jgi:hypothetical protein
VKSKVGEGATVTVRVPTLLPQDASWRQWHPERRRKISLP